jgi:hypothetical protein
MIMEDLDRLCEYSSFKRSKNSSKILRYLIQASIQGDTDNLKEYTIAREALGEGISFDPQLNPRIRVELKRLRERLKEAYEHLSPQESFHFFFEIPKGSYAPKFIPWEQSELLPIQPNKGQVQSGSSLYDQKHGHLHLRGFLEGHKCQFNLKLMMEELWFCLHSHWSELPQSKHQKLEIQINAYPLSQHILVYGKLREGGETLALFKEKVKKGEEEILTHAAKLAEEISEKLKEMPDE